MTITEASQVGDEVKGESPSTISGATGSQRVAVRLRKPYETDVEQRFRLTDPSKGLELSKNKHVRRVLKNRKFQFFLILPNQIVFWGVIFLGILGTVNPDLNFATAITWFLWFALVFVMMVVVGRAWCVMCPFGGFAEWIQRKSFWNRTQKALGLGRKFPESIAKYGLITSVGTFLLLTWLEEFFNIAGPGNPEATSIMVIGIVISAVTFFMVFERRTFCRYVCPLSALIGSVGAAGTAAGFRTKDRDKCLNCKTKECMRGGDEGFGCPWYTWPGSADSNLTCGLCSECYKACPSDNVGFFIQKPLTSMIAPLRRRADVAWSVLLLWGLVVFQQFNAVSLYGTIDNWLNTKMHFPQYPNPVDYIGIIFLVTLIMAGIAWVGSKAMKKDAVQLDLSGSPVNFAGAKASSKTIKHSFVDKKSQFRSFMLPLSYGLIPVVGADYFARQLPKFFLNVLKLVPDVGAWFGIGGGTNAKLFNAEILSGNQIVAVQVGVIIVGMLASLYAMRKIIKRDIVPFATSPFATKLVAYGTVLACGVGASWLYVMMHAAT